MNKEKEIKDLSNIELAKLFLDFFRCSALHYGLWFNEVNYQLGLDEALKTESIVFKKAYPILLKRLSSTLGFEVENDLPKALIVMPKEKMLKLLDAMSVDWLATDGLWFQTVEQRHDQFTAKRCNDTCWSRLSPYEAYRIKEVLNLPENGGLDALETALGYRMYARINIQATERKEGALFFRMVECRVQRARKLKGLEDYPCKSGGLVEYTTFARTIDKRIKTECVSCPPDSHPEEWACVWKFYIE
jgi:hypothetical protein